MAAGVAGTQHHNAPQTSKTPSLRRARHSKGATYVFRATRQGVRRLLRRRPVQQDPGPEDHRHDSLGDRYVCGLLSLNAALSWRGQEGWHHRGGDRRSSVNRDGGSGRSGARTTSRGQTEKTAIGSSSRGSRWRSLTRRCSGLATLAAELPIDGRSAACVSVNQAPDEILDRVRPLMRTRTGDVTPETWRT